MKGLKSNKLSIMFPVIKNVKFYKLTSLIKVYYYTMFVITTTRSVNQKQLIKIQNAHPSC